MKQFCLCKWFAPIFPWNKFGSKKEKTNVFYFQLNSFISEVDPFFFSSCSFPHTHLFLQFACLQLFCGLYLGNYVETPISYNQYGKLFYWLSCKRQLERKVRIYWQINASKNDLPWLLRWIWVINTQESPNIQIARIEQIRKKTKQEKKPRHLADTDRPRVKYAGLHFTLHHWQNFLLVFFWTLL